MPKVYTRRGDDGTTGLLYGGRVSKADARTHAYGECDEAVAALGVARAEAADAGLRDVHDLLLRLQGELFVVGAELATAPRQWAKLTDGVTRVTAEMVGALEREIDRLTDLYEQPRDFVVPGNTRVGAAIDLGCRVVRRAERAAVALARRGKVNAVLLAYLNRLADLVWVIARYAERGTSQPGHREARGG